jgi:putative transposase
MKRSRFTDSQILEALKRAEGGLAVPELCRELGISMATFYKWRSKYGGMDTSMMSRMKELEAENAPLRKMYIEEKLKAEIEITSEALQKNSEAISSARDGAAGCAGTRRSDSYGLCGFGISESCYRYKAKLSTENEEIADWLLRITGCHRTRGFLLCYYYLRNVKRFGWNHKHIYRICRKLELNLRIKPKKRLVRETPQPLSVPEAMKEV